MYTSVHFVCEPSAQPCITADWLRDRPYWIYEYWKWLKHFLTITTTSIEFLKYTVYIWYSIYLYICMKYMWYKCEIHIDLRKIYIYIETYRALPMYLDIRRDSIVIYIQMATYWHTNLKANLSIDINSDEYTSRDRVLDSLTFYAYRKNRSSPRQNLPSMKLRLDLITFKENSSLFIEHCFHNYGPRVILYRNQIISSSLIK